jgi:hypothetical protein
MRGRGSSPETRQHAAKTWKSPVVARSVGFAVSADRRRIVSSYPAPTRMACGRAPHIRARNRPATWDVERPERHQEPSPVRDVGRRSPEPPYRYGRRKYPLDLLLDAIFCPLIMSLALLSALTSPGMAPHLVAFGERQALPMELNWATRSNDSADDAALTTRSSLIPPDAASTLRRGRHCVSYTLVRRATAQDMGDCMVAPAPESGVESSSCIGIGT